MGNNITQNLSDSDDIKAKKGVFISQVNKLTNKLSVISSNVRVDFSRLIVVRGMGVKLGTLTANKQDG